MMGSEMMMGNRMMVNWVGSASIFGVSLVWLLYLAAGAFVFGIIFWWTYKLVLGKTKIGK